MRRTAAAGAAATAQMKIFDTLIGVRELAQRLEEPALAVIDCRFDLARTEWGAEAYAAARIPHARYAHLDRDLAAPVSRSSGRHPLPAPAALAERFGRWGIDADTQVVAYDQGAGAYAARLWWLLRWLGHSRAAVLDGGLTAWQAEGLPLEHGAPAPPAARRFSGRADPRLLASTEQIEQALSAGQLERGELVLIDARAADRFAGQNETLDPVAGHIPGALNHPFAENLGGGRFLEAAALRARYLTTLGGRSARRAVCMCGSGVTACHDLLALEIAGLTGARLYAGSWSEWIRDPKRPVARGD
jgi:thiosulfate/3-mercaptopyruvate sulfurtransferase